MYDLMEDGVREVEQCLRHRNGRVHVAFCIIMVDSLLIYFQFSVFLCLKANHWLCCHLQSSDMLRHNRTSLYRADKRGRPRNLRPRCMSPAYNGDLLADSNAGTRTQRCSHNSSLYSSTFMRRTFPKYMCVLYSPCPYCNDPSLFTHTFASESQRNQNRNVMARFPPFASCSSDVGGMHLVQISLTWASPNVTTPTAPKWRTIGKPLPRLLSNGRLALAHSTRERLQHPCRHPPLLQPPTQQSAFQSPE